MFVREVGVNSTLKEGQHLVCGDAIINTFHQILRIGGPYIGYLNPYFEQDNEFTRFAKRKKPLILTYDLTHDNETYFEKGMLIKQLPISGLLSYSGTFTGSTKGFDQFYSQKILVTE